MELRNYTPFPSQGFLSTARNGQKFQTIVVKATFSIHPGRPLRPHPEQQPLTMADEYYGLMNQSSIRAESDLAPVKPGTDVYFVDPVAYAPGNKPMPSWPVSVRVGPLSKAIRVTGPRAWTFGRLTGWRLSEPEPTDSVAIRYELAFGGHWKHEDESDGFDRNYVGRGFVNLKLVDRASPVPAPQLEDPADPVKGLGCPVTPVGLGPLTKTWQPRLKKAGTYDDAWLKGRWPIPPEDFDISFYNCAPPGLASRAHLLGAEALEFSGLTPDGMLRSRLPGLAIILAVRMRSGEITPAPTFLDTVVFDVRKSLATLAWRGYLPVDPPVRVVEIRLAEIPARAGHG